MRNELVPDGRGGVQAVATEETITIPVGLVFRSVGYRGTSLPDLPFDARRGVIPNVTGRVVEGVDSATPLHGVYVAGWIKRGPHGIIGTNKSCAAETVDHLLADAVAGRLPPAAGRIEDLEALFAERGIEVIGWSDWQAIDRAEIDGGKPAGRPREKLTDITEMIAVARQSESLRPGLFRYLIVVS